MQVSSITYPVVVAATLATIAHGAVAQQIPGNDEHHDIEEIIVEATAIPRTVQQLAQPTAVLAGSELVRKQSGSIGETLSQELGVSSTYFGPVASRPVIRGQYGERVRVLANGLDSLDASALSEDHQASVEGILANRVEIVRGPATLLYGSGAAGGLVNVVDNRILEAAPERPIAGTVALNAVSATGEKSGAGWVAIGSQRAVIHADYSRRDTGDVEIPGFAESARLRALEEAEGGETEEEATGIVANSDSTTETGALAMSIFGSRGFFGVSASRFDSEYGVPGHAHEEGPLPGAPADEEAPVRIDLAQDRVDLRSQVDLDGLIESARFRLASNSYEHTELEGANIGTIYETDGMDARIELRHGRRGPLEGVVGLQYKRIDFNAIGDEAFVPASDTRRASFFLFEELTLSDRLVLQGSARIERQTIEGPTLATDYDDTALGASIGAIWQFSPLTSVATNLSLTERHPNATELYSDGAHVAVQRFERGSVAIGGGKLDKESSANLDVTLRGNTETFDWTLTAFINHADDYIVLKPTDVIEDGYTVFEYMQADARLYGFEAEARLELLETARGHLHTRLFSDFVYGEENSSGDYLPRLPPLRLGAGLHYTMSRVEFIAEATYFAEQDKAAPNEAPTDSYVLLGATVSYSLPERGLYLFMRGSNLADEDARQHSSPLKDLVPLPGRALQAGIRYEF